MTAKLDTVVMRRPGEKGLKGVVEQGDQAGRDAGRQVGEVSIGHAGTPWPSTSTAQEAMLALPLVPLPEVDAGAVIEVAGGAFWSPRGWCGRR